MKVFRIDIDVISTTWEACSAYVEAETEDEARAIFDKDPWSFDWDHWDTVDSDVQKWEVEKVERDEWMEKHCIERKIGHWSEDKDDDG